jgi:hypothetical protein
MICAAFGIQILFSTVVIAPTTAAEVVSTDGQLVLYDTGVVFDTDSGLEWYAGPHRGMSWIEAKKWVTGLDAFGGGWRMPEQNELDAVRRIGDGVNNITPLLNTSGYWIWTGQTKDSSSRWIFSFSYGGEGWNGQAPADGGRAIAVRIRTRY